MKISRSVENTMTNQWSSTKTNRCSSQEYRRPEAWDTPATLRLGSHLTASPAGYTSSCNRYKGIIGNKEANKAAKDASSQEGKPMAPAQERVQEIAGVICLIN